MKSTIAPERLARQDYRRKFVPGKAGGSAATIPGGYCLLVGTKRENHDE